MRKQYILDTSVLINDPCAFKQFPHSDVIIPIVVVNELDKKKTSIGEVGKNARVCCKLLDQISDSGDISCGVLLDNDILLKVDATYYNLLDPEYSGFGSPDYSDTQILVVAYNYYKNHPQHDVSLVSGDLNLKIKAKARGIEAISYNRSNSLLSDLYSGNQVIINENAGLELQKNGIIIPSEHDLELNPNECLLFKDRNDNNICMGRRVENTIKLIKKVYPWNISSRNQEQSFAMELLMDKNIDLVTFIGRSGSGKSLTSLACALELVLNKREYEKLIIYRPIQAVGNDIGYLPGDMSEKLAPWFQAIMDNFELLFQNKGDWRRELEMYQKKGRIEMQAVTYIRGRSIPNAIILVDEAQNLSKEEIKTILTRVGENTKIILNGDIEQIDNTTLDAINNGLTYVIEKFKTSSLSGHITFVQGERSELATLASEIL